MNGKYPGYENYQYPKEYFIYKPEISSNKAYQDYLSQMMQSSCITYLDQDEPIIPMATYNKTTSEKVLDIIIPCALWTTVIFFLGWILMRSI